MASLGFVFNGLSLNIIISILSIEGVGTRVFNANTVVLKSSLYITLIDC